MFSGYAEFEPCPFCGYNMNEAYWPKESSDGSSAFLHHPNTDCVLADLRIYDFDCWNRWGLKYVWVVQFSNYEPREVESIHRNKNTAEKRAERLNDGELSVDGSPGWRVSKTRLF